MCEAMVLIDYVSLGIKRATATRCGRRPVEVHHRLTRARGGAVLDEMGETYHLIALCPRHHAMSDGAEAYLRGLLLDGMMVRDGADHYYLGTDEYLLARYGRRAVDL
jgi:hypothetical protein